MGARDVAPDVLEAWARRKRQLARNADSLAAEAEEFGELEPGDGARYRRQATDFRRQANLDATRARVARGHTVRRPRPQQRSTPRARGRRSAVAAHAAHGPPRRPDDPEERPSDVELATIPVAVFRRAVDEWLGAVA